MALPKLTPEQKKKALEKAQEMRRARADLRNKLKRGDISFAEILEKDNPVIGRMRVSYLLRSLPRIGKVKAEKIMEEVGIDESRRVQGLGKRQKEALLERLAK
ncbi:MAG TPA: integration host factor [Firmicutes bacterium]|nr:integration host factor [Candidatus Fermentithermobacillaceae bacterium]